MDRAGASGASSTTTPGPGPASAALAAAAKPSPASRTRTSGRPPVSGTLAASAASRPGSRQPSRGTSTSRIASPPVTLRASTSARSRISPGSSPCSSTTRQSRGSDRKASTRRASSFATPRWRLSAGGAAAPLPLLPLAAQLHRHAAEDLLRKLLGQPRSMASRAESAAKNCRSGTLKESSARVGMGEDAICRGGTARVARDQFPVAT